MNELLDRLERAVKENKEKGKWRWIFFSICAFIVGMIVIILFLKGGSENDDMDKKIKKAKKNNDDVLNSANKFLRKRTKFKRKKL